jgi:gliding motility-associated-like protein
MSAKSLLYKFTLIAAFVSITLLSKAQLVPQFTATPTSGCAPLVVNFQDQSTGNPVEWKWFLGTGSTFTLFSVLQNPAATFFNPGSYNIKLVIKNAAGQDVTIIKSLYITVNASPIVNFTANPTAGCFPLPVSFTDASTAGSGNIVTWHWDFGDGNSDNTQNPQHTYNNSGNYSVTLTVTNSAGCTKTITKASYISVSAGVNAAFTNSAPVGCSSPQTITFQNQSTGAGTLSYVWNFGDGLANSTLQNPTHQYTTAGSFNVTLTVTSNTGCSQTITHNNAVVIGTVQAAFTAPAIACVGQIISFANTSSPAPTAAAWTFGDGGIASTLNTTHTYTAPGNYTIQLLSTFGGCTDIFTQNITVNPKPTAAFTGSPLAACKAPLTVNYTSNNTVGAISYEWHFGDGGTSSSPNPSHTYTTVGNFTDTLIVTNANGCTDTLIKLDYIKIQPPVASINNLPQQGCAPLAWSFNSTVNSVDPIVGYEWFSNGVLFSTSPNPSKIFPVGNYTIKLVVTTAGGCTDTVTVVDGIKAALKPVPIFNATPTVSCAFQPITFHDLSTGTIDEWHWFFGDGDQSTLQNPTHAYQDTGLFTVTLVVGNNGCRDTIKLVDYIYIKPPIAVFNILSNCNDHFKRTFSDQSIGADTYLWDFGDGVGTSTLQNPMYTYAAVGTYTVTLTVHNNATGCDHTTSKQVLIADEFAAFAASLLQLCKNSSTTFTATSPHTPPAISSYLWSFGDGTSSNSNPASHVYLDANTYTVKLVITDLNGCKDSLTKVNYINVFGPTSNFASTLPGSCLLTAVNFNDLSITDGLHPIVEWKWEYGDAVIETLTAPPFSHAYAGAGIYGVTLTVKDNYGCTSTLVKPNLLTISQPVSEFSTQNTPSCPNSPVAFTNASTGPGLTYVWDFGDNTPTSILANPVHSYAADGDYTVKLTITDIYGCSDVEIKLAYVQIHTPVANFSVNQILSTCPPLNAQFTDLSLYANTYAWDFSLGNPIGGTSTNMSPSHTYNTAGIFNATLTVTGPGGCTSVKTQQIEVRGPTGNFTYAPLNGCNPLTVNFTGTTPDVVSFTWDYNDGVVEQPPLTNNHPTHIYTVPGFYVPKMILKDAAGCTVPIEGLDTIRVNGVVAAFDADTLLRCTSGVVMFNNNSFSNELITNYEWDFGDNSAFSTAASPSHLYAGPGIYYPKLKVTTQSACVNTYTATLPIKVVKTPDVSITQTANKCVPATMSFVGNLLNADTAAINWQWSFSNGIGAAITGTGQNLNSIIFPTAGMHNGTLIAINSSGCRDTSYTTLDVFPKPIVSAGADKLICKGTGQPLNATGAATYIWSPTVGLSCTTCPSPTATPDSVKNYIVTGTSSQGCVNTDTVNVAVQYPFKMGRGTNASLCIGGSKPFNATGAKTYVWSPSAGLNTTTGPSVIATPNSTTNYMVIGKDDKNCFADTAYYFVKVYPIPTVTAGNNQTINIGQTATLTPTVSSDVTSVVWSPNTWVISNTGQAITVKPNVDQQYKVSVSNLGGCTAEAAVNVFVICDGANVFIPNTFSPNGDGNNEIFYPRGTGLFSIKSFRIFNRWGEQIFEKYSFKANDEKAGWDGSFKGQQQISDVYVYMMDIQCQNGSILVYKGNIALIK